MVLQTDGARFATSTRLPPMRGGFLSLLLAALDVPLSSSMVLSELHALTAVSSAASTCLMPGPAHVGGVRAAALLPRSPLS